MSNQLDLPDELKHLVEKRANDDRRESSCEPPAEPPSPADVAAAVERRHSLRRATDGEQIKREAPEAK